ncbi:hypothetical protein C2W27_14450 [Salmonella enterica]|nr:hypothetical protein [Salmonella enterica]
MTIDKAFEIVLALLLSAGGFWVRSLQTEVKELRGHIERVRAEYQRRDDAQATQRQVLDLLQDMRRAIERIDEKLDRKADK